jgi:hypothetical protein
VAFTENTMASMHNKHKYTEEEEAEESMTT